MKQFFILLIITFIISAVNAQEYEYQNFLKTRLKVDERELISKKLKIGTDEKPAFWELFDRYQTETSKLNQEWFNQVRNYIYNGHDFNNKVASQITDTILMNQVLVAMLNVKYANEFGRVINERQIFLLYQISGRLRLQVSDIFMEELPLLEISNTEK